MTPQEIAARVSQIVGGDDEVAHTMEDVLHQDVLRAIAAGECADPAACATEALQTLNIKFERWCA